VISIDVGKGVDFAVTQVFKNGVEHRECMRHLVANFQKQFRGEVFEKHCGQHVELFKSTGLKSTAI
jgi:hypothetical protein